MFRLHKFSLPETVPRSRCKHEVVGAAHAARFAPFFKIGNDALRECRMTNRIAVSGVSTLFLSTLCVTSASAAATLPQFKPKICPGRIPEMIANVQMIRSLIDGTRKAFPPPSTVIVDASGASLLSELIVEQPGSA